MPISRMDALHGLDSDLPLFRHPLYKAHRAAFRTLVAGGAFELRCDDLNKAVSRLETLAD